MNNKIKKTAHSTNTNTQKKSQVNKEKGEKIAFEKVSQERWKQGKKKREGEKKKRKKKKELIAVLAEAKEWKKKSQSKTHTSLDH